MMKKIQDIDERKKLDRTEIQKYYKKKERMLFENFTYFLQV